jgi:hypothetical protein
MAQRSGVIDSARRVIDELRIKRFTEAAVQLARTDVFIFADRYCICNVGRLK